MAMVEEAADRIPAANPGGLNDPHQHWEAETFAFLRRRRMARD